MKAAWEAAKRQKTGVSLIEAKPAEEEEQKDGDKPDQKEMREAVFKKRTREEMMNSVSEAEIEEHRRKRTAANDPIGKFFGEDELISQSHHPSQPEQLWCHLSLLQRLTAVVRIDCTIR